MENYINEARWLKDLPTRCWILRDNKFNLTVEKERQLPVIPRKYEYILKKMGINSYSIFEIEKKGRMSSFIRYWDQYHYQEEEMELPLYEFYDEKFHFIRMHKGKVPNAYSVDAARKLSAKVDFEISRARKDETRQLLKKLLGDKNAVYVKRCTFKGNLEEGRFENYHVFYIRRMDGTETNHIVIFDLNRIYDEDVVLELPEKDVKFILGKKQCHANKWRETLGIDKIKIDVI